MRSLAWAALAAMLAACGAGTPVATRPTAAATSNAPRSTPPPRLVPYLSPACAQDRHALDTAEEAYFAQHNTYANEYELRRSGLLRELSVYHDVTVGTTQAAAQASTNAERSPETGAARAIKGAPGCP